jgi:type I restriction enzyme S subunit
MKTEIATKYKETEIGTIPEEWDVKALGEVLDITSSKRIFMSEYVNSGVPFYRGKEIIEKANGDRDISTQLYISEKRFSEIEDKFGAPREGDILMSSVGTLGVSYQVGKNERFYFKDGNLTWFRNYAENIWPIYIQYWLRSPVGQRSILSTAIGSTQPALTIDGLKKIVLALPQKQEQKRITEILSSLDYKIELNRQINDNLEKTVSMLFKRWFIDFNFPDKNGKPYKTSEGKMIESELGEIPNEWQLRLMTDFVNIDKGLSYKGSDLNDGGKNLLIGLKCFERGGGFRADGTKRFAGEFKKQHLLNAGDLIVAMTDLTQGAEVLGKPAIVPNINDAEHLVASLDISILRPKTQQISKAYLYTLFMRQETQDYLFGYSNGSTVLHLSIKGLNEFKLAVAPDDILQKFNDIIEPIFSQIQILNDELQNLQTIRDSLLPRLMSGKIRVN